MDFSALPRVAIITRTKNRPLLLRRAIESVLGQIFGDYVHVIINDGGSPSEVEFLLDEYRHRYKGRVQVIHNQASLGMQNASNLGIQSSKSDFVTIHDDDDSWHESFLVECVSTLDACGPESSFQGVVTQSYRINEKITSDGKVMETGRELFYPFDAVSLYRLASDNLFPPIAFVYRRQVHDEIGYFDEKFTVLGDWDFNLRFVSKYDIVTSRRPLAYYHWRITEERGAYNNSVTIGLDEHKSKLVVLQNHYLREDLKAGKVGLGHLLSNSKMLHGIAGLGWQNHHLSDEIKTKVTAKPPPSQFAQFLRRCWSLTDVIVPPPLPKPVPVFNPRAGLPTVDELREKMKTARVLSLDVFDTALVRGVAKPTDVFIAMESRVRDILKNKDLSFPQLRIKAERAARQLSLENGKTDEITLAQIYEAFDPDGPWDRKLTEKLVALELETEFSFLYANPEIYDLYLHAKRLGLPTVYISDMYLPPEVIRKLLLKNGFDVEKMFVSNEHGISKHNGGLYEIMIKDLGVQPDQVLHLGDNYHSDYTNAVRYGISAVHTEHLRPRSMSDEAPNSLRYEEGDLATSLCLGLTRRYASRHNRNNSTIAVDANAEFAKKLGYEVAGPITFLFLHWLAVKSQEAGIKRLFFFSRDGYILVKAFEILKKRWNLDVEAEYLYASRRLYNFARIERLDNQSLDFLLTPNPGLKVRDFIERCGFDVGQHVAKLHSLGFPDIEAVITTYDGQFTNPEHRGRLRQFLYSVERDLLRRCREERELLYEYLDEKSFSLQDSAVVDVGWRASLCQSLQELMLERGEKGRLQSYLFGTWEYAQRAIDAGCRLDSFFFHLDNPLSRKALVSECVEIVELLFSAPHPSILGLKKKDGEFGPIFGSHEYDSGQLALTEQMRSSALKFVMDATELVDNVNSVRPSDNYVESILNRLLRHPTGEEAKILGRYPHRDGFGDKGAVRYLANPLSSTDTPLSAAELKFAYDHCYWKAGFRAQLTDRQKQSIHLL